MLRCPRTFLCTSLFLLSATIIGHVIKGIYTGIKDQIRLDETWKRILMYLIIGSTEAIWDCLICGVLLYNLLNSNKRCRFGSIHGRASFGIALLFESVFSLTWNDLSAGAFVDDPCGSPVFFQVVSSSHHPHDKLLCNAVR